MKGKPSTRVAEALLASYYLVGLLGICLGFMVGDAAEALDLVALIAVGGLGILGFVRHSIFHRADAALTGAVGERRNNFQVEVGLANLALGLVAVVAYVGHWNVAALAAVTMVYGIYLFQSGVLDVVALADLPPHRRKSTARLALLATFAIALALLYFSVRVLARVPAASR